MLKPKDLTTQQYSTALKPTLGYEQQLYVSVQAHTVLGPLDIVAPNSGVFTPSVPDTAALAVTPQELLMVLDTDADLGAADLVVSITGTDQNNAALTGTATFTPPGYAQDKSRVFPRGFAVEVTATAGKRFKTITGYTVTSDGSLAATPRLWLIGTPSLDYSDSGTFRKIGTKTKLDIDPQVPMPVAIPDGRRKGAYIKAGEIDIGNVSITTNIPSNADGLARYNGIRLTGWVREMKEEKLNTQNIFLFGLIITAKNSGAGGAEAVEQTGTGMYEVYASIIAK